MNQQRILRWSGMCISAIVLLTMLLWRGYGNPIAGVRAQEETPRPTPTNIGTETSTPDPRVTPTTISTNTLTPVPTNTPTPSPTSTPTPVATGTFTPVPTSTPIPAATAEPTQKPPSPSQPKPPEPAAPSAPSAPAGASRVPQTGLWDTATWSVLLSLVLTAGIFGARHLRKRTLHREPSQAEGHEH